MRTNWHHDFDKTTKPELIGIINSLAPDDETYFAKKYLLRMLKSEGLSTTLAFIRRSSEEIKDYDGIDFSAFNRDERMNFRRTKPRYWRPEEFSEVFGWGIPGVFYFLIDGTTKAILVLNNLLEKHGDELFDDTKLESFYETMSKYGSPIASMLIGVALFRAAIKYRKEIGLNHLKDAINEMRKNHPEIFEEKTSPHTQRYRRREDNGQHFHSPM